MSIGEQAHFAIHFQAATSACLTSMLLQRVWVFCVTTLKRICRDNHVSRRPYRQHKSLWAIYNHIKRDLDDGTGQHNMPKLAALEKQKQAMQVWLS